MKNKEELETCFKNTPWGTSEEHDYLLKMGRYLALPLYPDKSWDKHGYEQSACELASGILCAFIYKNNKFFNAKSLKYNIPHCILQYMVDANVIKLKYGKYKVTDYYRFEKWLDKIISHQLPDEYRITGDFKPRTVHFDRLERAYSKNPPFLYSVGLGKVHPFTYYIQKFINRTDCSDLEGVLAIKTMLDGLMYYEWGKIPDTTEIELKNEIKKASRNMTAGLQNLYRKG